MIKLTCLVFVGLLACGSTPDTAPQSDSDSGLVAPDARSGTPDAQPDGMAHEDASPADAAFDALDAGAQGRDAGSPSDAVAPDAAPVTLHAGDGGVLTVDIVSPNRCIVRNGHLFNCVVPPLTLENDDTSGTAPLRTRLTRRTAGNCSSTFDIRLSLAPTGGAPSVFHLSDGTADVRRFDRGPLTTLTITDSSPFAGIPAYDDTCRIALEVQFNEVDVP